MDHRNQDPIYCEEEKIQWDDSPVNLKKERRRSGSDGRSDGKAAIANPATCEELEVADKQLKSFLATLSEMSHEMELMDVTLNCGGRTFTAHKVILCASSPYFRAMFHSDLCEAKTGIVDIEGVSPEAFEIIMKFMYFGSFSPVHDTNELKALLAAAHLFQCTNFYEYCWDKYIKKLNHDTFIDIWNSAELYQNLRMQYRIPNELAKMFSMVKKSREFLSLSASQLSKLVSELGKSQYNSDEVLKSVLYWMKQDFKNRSCHMSRLIPLVDLNRVSANCLSSVLKKEDFMKECAEVKSLLMDMAAARLSGSSVQGADADPTKFVVVRNMPHAIFNNYDLKKNTWSENRSFALGALWTFGAAQHYVPANITAVIVKGDLYCVTTTPSNHVSAIDIRGEVKQLVKYMLSLGQGQCPLQYCCSLLENRTSFGLAALGGEIYIVGGTDVNGSKLRTVERYDPVSKRCFRVTPMINAHCTQGVVASNNFLYVVDVENATLTIERYDPKTTQWCLVISQGIVTISGQSIFTSNDLSPNKVAVYAGKFFFVQNDKLIAYEPDFNCWTQIKTPGLRVKKIGGMSNPNIQCNSLMLLAADNKIYLFDCDVNSIRHMTSFELSNVSYAALAAF